MISHFAKGDNGYYKMNKILRKHRAFSLIELLIVMAIISIMSVVAYASLTSGRSQTRVRS